MQTHAPGTMEAGRPSTAASSGEMSIGSRRPLGERSQAQVRAALRGFPADCIEAALRYRVTGHIDDALAMLPGMIIVHLPRGSTPPPRELSDALRLDEDLGLDSLALMEMAFRLEDFLGLTIESGDVAVVDTVGDLRRFLAARLGRGAGPTVQPVGPVADVAPSR